MHAQKGNPGDNVTDWMAHPEKAEPQEEVV